VYVPEDVDPAFESSVISGCFPLEVVFEGLTDSPQEIVYAEWDFGDGTFSNDIDSTSHSYLDVGWYPVSYSILTQYGCEFSSMGEDSIRVNPWPIAQFAADPWEQTLPGNRIEMINYSLGAVSYEWDFAGLDFSNEYELVYYLPLEGGDYPIQLTAINEWGCADSVTYFVRLIDRFTLYAPSAFTPDHDGKNDVWKVIGQDVDPNAYHVEIWNRWGQVVFESWNIEEVWLGEFERGDYFVEDDLYHYQIDVSSLSTAAKYQFCGTVTVIR
jgi:gliding motility-associated-like protein